MHVAVIDHAVGVQVVRPGVGTGRHGDVSAEHAQIGLVESGIVDEVHAAELHAREGRGRRRVGRAGEQTLELQQVAGVDEAVAGDVGRGVELRVFRKQDSLEAVARARDIAGITDAVEVEISEAGATAARRRAAREPLDVVGAGELPGDHGVGVVAVGHAEEAGLEDVAIDLVGRAQVGVDPGQDRGIAHRGGDVLKHVDPVGGAVGGLDPDVVVAHAARERLVLVERRLGLQAIDVEHLLEVVVDRGASVAPLPEGSHREEVHALGQDRCINRLLVEAVAVGLRKPRAAGGDKVFKPIRHVARRGDVHGPAAVEVEPLVDPDHRLIAIGRPIAVAARQRDRLRGKSHGEGVAIDHPHAGQPRLRVRHQDRTGLRRGLAPLKLRRIVARDHGAHARPGKLDARGRRRRRQAVDEVALVLAVVSQEPGVDGAAGRRPHDLEHLRNRACAAGGIRPGGIAGEFDEPSPEREIDRHRAGIETGVVAVTEHHQGGVAPLKGVVFLLEVPLAEVSAAVATAEINKRRDRVAEVAQRVAAARLWKRAVRVVVLIGVVVDDRVARPHQRKGIGHVHHVGPEVVVALHKHHPRRAVDHAVVVDVEASVDHAAEVVGRAVIRKVVFNGPELGEIERVAIAPDVVRRDRPDVLADELRHQVGPVGRGALAETEDLPRGPVEQPAVAGTVDRLIEVVEHPGLEVPGGVEPEAIHAHVVDHPAGVPHQQARAVFGHRIASRGVGRVEVVEGCVLAGLRVVDRRAPEIAVGIKAGIRRRRLVAERARGNVERIPGGDRLADVLQIRLVLDVDEAGEPAVEIAGLEPTMEIPIGHSRSGEHESRVAARGSKAGVARVAEAVMVPDEVDDDVAAGAVHGRREPTQASLGAVERLVRGGAEVKAIEDVVAHRLITRVGSADRGNPGGSIPSLEEVGHPLLLGAVGGIKPLKNRRGRRDDGTGRSRKKTHHRGRERHHEDVHRPAAALTTFPSTNETEILHDTPRFRATGCEK